MLGAEELLIEQRAVSLVLGAPGGMVGTVIDAGEAARALVGKHVVVPAWRSCGACLPCRRGFATLCRAPGPVSSLSPRVTLPSRLAVEVDPPEPHLAVLADAGLWAYAAVIRGSVEPNRAAIVLGDGPLVRFLVALVEHRGAKAIRDPGTLDVEPFGLPVLSTGSAEVAITCAPEGGTVVLCSAQPGDAALGAVAHRGLAVHGVLGGHPDLLPELLAFVKKGALDVRALVHQNDLHGF